jgi:hypothetical protein
MRFWGMLIPVIFAAIAGCSLLDRWAEWRGNVKAPPTFSQYHLNGWSWDGVARVVVLPFLNESEYTRAGDEVRLAFTSEFQRLGRFEVMASPPDERALFAANIHRSGRFDEAEMLDLAKQTRADVVIFGSITQYSPYHPRPRLGLILQAVGPMQAKVVASVDGLWDTDDKRISDRLRTFYRQRPHERLPFIRNNVIASDDAFASELALESPALFQRFVCHEASLILLGLPIAGVVCAEPQPGMGSGQLPYPPGNGPQLNPNGTGLQPNPNVVGPQPNPGGTSQIPGPGNSGTFQQQLMGSYHMMPWPSPPPPPEVKEER